MSAGSSVKGSVRGGLIGIVVLVLAELVGFPVGQIASALAFVAFAMGSLCLVVGLSDAARAFVGPGVMLVGAAIAAPMLHALLLGAVADPRLRIVVVCIVGVMVLAGLLLLVAKTMGHPAEKHAPVRPTSRRRTAVTDPEPVLGERRHGTRSSAPAGAHVPGGDDDLGLFGGGHHAPR